MNRFVTVARTLSFCAALIVASAPPSSLAAKPTDAASASPGVDSSYALVQLNGEPLASAARTKPAPGKKVDFSSATVRSYRAQLQALRNDYKSWLRANVPGARVTGEFDLALNAVAVKLNGATLAQVSATPMVKAAQYQATVGLVRALGGGFEERAAEGS